MEPTELKRPEGQRLSLEHQLCHGPLGQRELPLHLVVLFEPAGADAQRGSHRRAEGMRNLRYEREGRSPGGEADDLNEEIERKVVEGPVLGGRRGLSYRLVRPRGVNEGCLHGAPFSLNSFDG